MADDMGLGKTYQVSALVASNRCDPYRSTLIVTVVSTIPQWQAVLCDFADMPPIVVMPNANQPLPNKIDVVLTTYSVFQQRKLPMALMSRNWQRVVLDEGHVIKSTSSKTHQHLSNLIRKNQYRWIVSGSPVQNNREELRTLLSWTGCHHGEDAHKESIMRRTIEEVCSDSLPKLTTHIKYLLFKYPEERVLYNLIAQNTTVSQKRARHLDKTLRLRQVCIHPKLCFNAVTGSAVELEQGICEADPVYDDIRACGMNMEELQSLQAKQLCDFDDIPEPVPDPAVSSSSCQPVIDVHFEQDVVSLDDDNSAFVTRDWPNGLGEVMLKHGVQLSDLQGSAFQRSTKMEYLTQQLLGDANSDIKSLVFCKYREEMELLMQYLNAVGVCYCVYNGDMSKSKREWALHNFKQVQSITTMIIQIQAGGVGLNLQMASKVYITAPEWNPVIEQQAIARVYRLKQSKPVTCVRLVMSGTVEELACMHTQATKLNIISGCLDGDASVARSKMGLNDKCRAGFIHQRYKLLQDLVARDLHDVQCHKPAPIVKGSHVIGQERDDVCMADVQ